jgi:tetratricopeptide (TPR) repeat protein
LRRSAAVLLFLCLIAVIFLTPKIDAYNYAFTVLKTARDVPFFVRFLGESRAILSNLSILQADLYLHGGVGHFTEEHKEGLAIGQREEGVHEEEDACEHKKSPGKVNPFNILFRISEEKDITEHIHLHGDQTKELIPWFYFSAKIDPHNVLAYTLGSYWLAAKMNKVEEGFVFLKEGLRNNPDSWEINAELGRMYFTYTGDHEAALRYLYRARTLIQDATHDKFQERYVLFYLALSYEELGLKEEALKTYRELNELFPEAYNKKIEELS